MDGSRKNRRASWRALRRLRSKSGGREGVGVGKSGGERKLSAGQTRTGPAQLCRGLGRSGSLSTTGDARSSRSPLSRVSPAKSFLSTIIIRSCFELKVIAKDYLPGILEYQLFTWIFNNSESVFFSFLQ